MLIGIQYGEYALRGERILIMPLDSKLLRIWMCYMEHKYYHGRRDAWSN